MSGEGFLYDDPSKLIQLRDNNEVNKAITQGIKTITKNPKNITKFGSWTYKSQLYPGDVDLVELEERCCDIKTATRNFVKDTQKIVKNILKKKNYYLGDVKAGLDQDFMIDIGKLTFNKVGVPSITGYNGDNVIKQIMKLEVENKLTRDETDKLMMLATSEMNQENYEKLYAALREKWLLRWSAKEIEKGYKILPGNRKKTLAEAINEYTMTKIDMWTKVNERFIEFSNVLTYYLVDKAGNRTLLNFANNIETMKEDLKYEVQKYAFSIKDFKPFKLVKRMWSIARSNKDYKMVELLTPLMQTDLGRLSQINSEIETLIMMLEKIRSPPIAAIISEIDNFKWRLGNIFEINIDAPSVIHHIDLMLKRNKNIVKNKRYLIENLDELHTFLKKTINDETIRALKKMGLFPPPARYLPNNMNGGFVFETGHPERYSIGGCDNPDSPFCPKKRGKGLAKTIFKKAANAYRRVACSDKARPLLDGELHPKCWNFCGPGTRIDLPEVRNTTPYDGIDAVCKQHDIDYYDAKDKPDKPQKIRLADIKMLDSLESHKNESGYSLAKAAISGKVTAENILKDLIKDKFKEHYGSD
jgi:hypothetical protein